ncbi:helix-turn-helix domain-containing protein [Dysgonomonas sp. Marseille-P4677]|uniref:AraC family transcriptional regulator n=1 Tax=Dysgonomonas sp. Marseille-P4677 TaxID=2364790 RepID=UPI001912DAA9|nr:AraC family transcriptional regulator [Dysgonomonas sp. Marseille-P4677]MBK5722192.1 helix-turn-helix domain-containing protein [Dysgonomonas sp. Marseille-P4677]
MSYIFREITPLSEKDCFMVFARKKKEFTFPLHVHNEYELNFIENGKGAKRIVGDSIEEIDDLELAFIASPSLEHGWFTHNCKSEEIKEITIQFHSNLFRGNMLDKNQFRSIKGLFDRAVYGVTFSKETIEKVKSEIISLSTEYASALSVLKLLSILYTLSISPSIRELSGRTFNTESQSYDSQRVEKTHTYMLENYMRNIKLSDVASVVGMAEPSLSRFLKQKTGRNFVSLLNEIRLGHVTRMLIDTNRPIEEICIDCGFNNLSNFNRIFKREKGCTPSEFRENYKDSRIFI